MLKRHYLIAAALVLASSGILLARIYAAGLMNLEPEKRGYLGVYVDEVTPEKAKQLNLPGEYGVIVSRVAEESPAAKAGVKENDVIIEYNGTRVEGALQFGRMISETPEGRTVTLKIIREGKKQELKATIGSRSTTVLSGPELRFRIPEIRVPEVRFPPVTVQVWGYSRLGIRVQSLTEQLGEYFGVSGGRGVLVTMVRANTPAARAGLRAGDVIVAVDGKEIASPNELSRELARREGEVPLTIMRDKQKQTITVKLEKRDESQLDLYFAPDWIDAEVFVLDEFFDHYPFGEVRPFVRDLERQREQLRRSIEEMRRYQERLRMYQQFWRAPLLSQPIVRQVI